MKKWTPRDIKNFRTRFKITQKELAELVGVRENYIYLLEKGERKPGKTLMLLFGYVEKDLKKSKK